MLFVRLYAKSHARSYAGIYASSHNYGSCDHGITYKTVNLVNKLGWLKGMLSVNGRSYMIHHVLTVQIFDALKKLHFWQNCKEVLNQLSSANWAELHKSHVQRSRGEVTCKDHVQGWGHVQRTCKLLGVICIYKWVEFNSVDSMRVKT